MKQLCKLIYNFLLIQEIACRIVDGIWSDWSKWSTCNQHCQSTRTRICQQPTLAIDQNIIQLCAGDSVQRKICFRGHCMAAHKINDAVKPPPTPVLEILTGSKPSLDKKTETIVISVVTITVLLIALILLLYFCVFKKRQSEDVSNDPIKPRSKETLRERISASTRRFIDSDPIRGWLFKADGDSNLPPVNPKSTKRDGFYDEQGQFIQHRSKDADGGVLPPIPAGDSQQPQSSTSDSVYVNGKYLEHHLVAKKGNDQKNSSKMNRRPLPDVPSSAPVDYRTLDLPPVPDSSIPSYSGEYKHYQKASPYEQPVPVDHQIDYKTMPLPSLPTAHGNPYEGIYEQPIASQKRRQLPPTPLDSHVKGYGGARPRRQLPKTPDMENAYLFSEHDEDNYLDLKMINQPTNHIGGKSGMPTEEGGYCALQEADLGREQYEKLKSFQREPTSPVTPHYHASTRQQQFKQKKLRQPQ